MLDTLQHQSFDDFLFSMHSNDLPFERQLKHLSFQFLEKIYFETILKVKYKCFNHFFFFWKSKFHLFFHLEKKKDKIKGFWDLVGFILESMGSINLTYGSTSFKFLKIILVKRIYLFIYLFLSRIYWFFFLWVQSFSRKTNFEMIYYYFYLR